MVIKDVKIFTLILQLVTKKNAPVAEGRNTLQLSVISTTGAIISQSPSTDEEARCSHHAWCLSHLGSAVVHTQPVRVGLHLLGNRSTGLWSIKLLSPQGLVQENLEMLLLKLTLEEADFFLQFPEIGMNHQSLARRNTGQ